MNAASEHTEHFKELLEEVSTEVQLLKKQLKEARKEQLHIINKLEEDRSKQTDIISATSESERLAMRQKITAMIHKIDRHLEGN